MTELLNDISRNPGASILVCIVGLIALKVLLDLISNFFNFIHNCLCAFTGKYPAPRPVVQCDCDDSACFCCRDSDCDPGCKCYEEREDRE